MKKLDFTPSKSKNDFRKNYALHDLAEKYGKNLLIQWGLDFKDFGGDKRYERVWESGSDKPDIIISQGKRTAFIDWKAKKFPSFLINERAYNSYSNWSKNENIPVIVVFFLFDDQDKLIDKRMAKLGLHKCNPSKKKQWDKNRTVEFENDLPEFTKANLLAMTEVSNET